MNSDEANQIASALADIFKSPFHLLEYELQETYSFNMKHYPKEVYTEDDPPVKLRKDAEIIPIDKFLGLYHNTSQPIIATIKHIYHGKAHQTA